MNRLDWPTLMQAGLLGLGLQPDVFWKLTPAELAFLLGQNGQDQALDRTTLDALLAQFPDKRSDPNGSD